MSSKKKCLALLGGALLSAFPNAAAAQQQFKTVHEKISGGFTGESSKTANRVLWCEPADIASRDLSEGPGGKEHEPILLSRSKEKT